MCIVQSWDEDGYRARWKFEVKPNVNCAFVRQQVLLQPVGIIIEVDSEFLDGTGKVRIYKTHDFSLYKYMYMEKR